MILFGLFYILLPISSNFKKNQKLGGNGNTSLLLLLQHDPDDGLLQHACPLVGRVHLQLGGDEGESNVEQRVPLEAGSAEAHPAIEARPAVAEEVARPGCEHVNMILISAGYEKDCL